MQKFCVGSANIDSALEMTLTGRPIAWLGASEDMIDSCRHWLSPYFLEEGDTWSLNFRSWIVRHEDKVIVIDPCTGNGRPNTMPPFDMLDVPFLERFEATGTRVEDVDIVFCTHMHHDHCGWNTQLRDGRWVPTFPNARYIFLQREYDRWHPANAGQFPRAEFNDGVFERSIAPVVEAGLADLVMPGHPLAPGLQVAGGAGHTEGHAMLKLSSSGERAIFTGDAFHHPLQLTYPEVQFGGADNDEQAMKTRQQLVEDAITDNALLIPAHLPFPHAGWVRREGGAVEFVPLDLPRVECD